MDNAYRIKFKLLHQFYGLEEYMDLPAPIPKIISDLDQTDSEFGFIAKLSDLDLWYFGITNNQDYKPWCPFFEHLIEYADRYGENLSAHFYPEKQWSNNEIFNYLEISQ